MSQTTATEKPVSIAQPGSVCRRCLFGIKGLAYGAVCTECGASIGEGIDPLWWGNRPLTVHDNLRRAARIALWPTTAACVISLASFAIWYGPTAVTQGYDTARAAYLVVYAALALVLGPALLRVFLCVSMLWTNRLRLSVLVGWLAFVSYLIHATTEVVSLCVGTATLSWWLMLLWPTGMILGSLLGITSNLVFLKLGKHTDHRQLELLGFAGLFFACASAAAYVPSVVMLLTYVFGQPLSPFGFQWPQWLHHILTALSYVSIVILPVQLWITSSLMRRMIEAKAAAV